MKNIQLPGSKSISNRVLLLSALSDKPVILENLLESDDTVYMRGALEKLGAGFEDLGKGQLKVFPMPVGPVEVLSEEHLYIGNAGTAARFLSCVSLLLGKGEGFELAGNEYMEKRPQGDLFTALRLAGIDIKCVKSEGFVPAAMHNMKGEISNEIEVSGKVSSQFLSGLLLVGPRMENGLTIKVLDDVPSWPYVEMTVAILKIWGVSVTISDDRKTIKVVPGLMAPEKYMVPSDMSAASYPLAWSVLKKEKICITNFGAKTLQGDEGFLEIIEKVGGEVRRSGDKCYIDPRKKLLPIGDVDWEKMPDVSMTGMILAACADGKSKFTGLESLRVKECDRIIAMEQLKYLGINIEVEGDEMMISGGGLDKLNTENCEVLVIDSFDDHRIAMCFGILRSYLGLGSDPHGKSFLQISDPACVAKTWPGFWNNLADWEGELRPVSGVILKRIQSEDEAEYLIVKKPRKDNAWQFPQGGRDDGESDLQAARRELLEECGAGLKVKFKGERPVGSYQYFFPKSFDRHDPGIFGAKVQFFVAEYLGGSVEVDDHEIVDYKWVTKDDLDDYFEGKYLEVMKGLL